MQAVSVNSNVTLRRVVFRISCFFVAGFCLVSCALYSEKNNSLLSIERRLNNDFFGVIWVSKEGKPQYQRAFGLANASASVPNQVENRFRIGSVTKTFTSAVVFDLAAEGKLMLQSPVSAFLEGVPNGERITVLDLLEHRSGLGDFSQADWEALLLPQNNITKEFVYQLIISKPPVSEPGEEFEYNNAGYVLLGYVIEMLTGKSYVEVLHERVLRPLALNNTGFEAHDSEIEHLSAGHDKNQHVSLIDYDYTALASAGGLYSNAEDLHKWCLAQKQFNVQSAGWKSGVRFGLNAVWHTGNVNDYSAILVRFPQIDGCYVVLSNVGRTAPTNDILRALPAIFFTESNNNLSS